MSGRGQPRRRRPPACGAHAVLCARRPPGCRPVRSYDVEFLHRPPLRDTLIAEQSEVERYKLLMRDQFGDRAPGGGRLLQAVAREPVGENEILDLRMAPDHGVLVERVVVVMPGP